MTAPGVLPDHVTDPAGFLLAAADVREAAIYGAPDTTWRVSTQVYDRGEEDYVITADDPRMGEFDSDEMARSDIREAAVYIAAEANPAHARAEVALWRGVARRHVPTQALMSPRLVCLYCSAGMNVPALYPCSDMQLVVAAARAYQDGTGT